MQRLGKLLFMMAGIVIGLSFYDCSLFFCSSLMRVFPTFGECPLLELLFFIASMRIFFLFFYCCLVANSWKQILFVLRTYPILAYAIIKYSLPKYCCWGILTIWKIERGFSKHSGFLLIVMITSPTFSIGFLGVWLPFFVLII